MAIVNTRVMSITFKHILYENFEQQLGRESASQKQTIIIILSEILQWTKNVSVCQFPLAW